MNIDLSKPPIVVYHVAAMGDWQQVVKEQFRLLRDVGLAEVRVSFVGEGLAWLLEEAREVGIQLAIVRSDPNISHYETFAMLEVERLAKVEKVARPILYFHTKGVSCPGHRGKQMWRRAMEDYVVRRWESNVRILADDSGYDAVGFNWHQNGEQHFSGTFWIARPDWICRLPDFAWYHGQKGLVRYTCEMWIGAQQWCRAYSLACANQPTWNDDYDFDAILPPPGSGLRMNLGCGPFYLKGWTNVDSNRRVKSDLCEDVAVLPSVPNSSVDEIYAGHVLEHVVDVKAALEKWYDVLKPGGRLVIAVPDCEGAVRLWRAGTEFPVIQADPDTGVRAVITGYSSRQESTDDLSGLQCHRRVFDRSLLRICLEFTRFVDIREIDGHEAMYAPCSKLGWQIAMSARKPDSITV